MTDVMFCGQCGDKVLADAKFCGSCGEPQTALETVRGDPAGDSSETKYVRSASTPTGRAAATERSDSEAPTGLVSYATEPLAHADAREAHAPAAQTSHDVAAADPPPGQPALPANRMPPPARPLRPPAGSPVALPGPPPTRPPSGVAVAGAAPPVAGATGFVPAHHGRRLAALAIDGLLVSVVAIVAWLLIAVVLFGPLSSASSDAAVVTGSAIVVLGYVIVFPIALLCVNVPLLARQGSNNGQTFGKQALGLRVVCLDGQPMSFARASMRELVWRWLVIGFLGSLLIIPPLLNCLWPLFNECRQALHDKASATVVVKA